jgi:hypothetical protein
LFGIFALTKVIVEPVPIGAPIPDIDFLAISHNTFKKHSFEYKEYIRSGNIAVVIVESIPRDQIQMFVDDGFEDIGNNRVVYYHPKNKPPLIIDENEAKKLRIPKKEIVNYKDGKTLIDDKLTNEESLIYGVFLGLRKQQQGLKKNTTYGGNRIPAKAEKYNLGGVDVGITRGKLNKIYINYKPIEDRWNDLWKEIMGEDTRKLDVPADGDCNFYSLMHLINEDDNMNDFKAKIWLWFTMDIYLIPTMHEIEITPDNMEKLYNIFISKKYHEGQVTFKDRIYLTLKFQILYYYTAMIGGLKWIIVTKESISLFRLDNDGQLITDLMISQVDIATTITNHVCHIIPKNKRHRTPEFKYYNVLYKSECHYNIGITPHKSKESITQPCQAGFNRL